MPLPDYAVVERESFANQPHLPQLHTVPPLHCCIETGSQLVSQNYELGRKNNEEKGFRKVTESVPF